MKKLLIVSMLTLLATASGCRTCSSWWNRGDSCDTCAGGTVRTYSSGTLVTPPATIIPGQSEILPGPS